MPLASLLTALVVFQAGPPSTSPSVGASDLNAMAEAARDFVPKDEFDSPPIQKSLSGRSFVVEVKPWGTNSPPVACFGYPMWSYSASTGTLYVSTGADELMLSSFRSKHGPITKKPGQDTFGEEIRYFASDCARADLPSYTASNAYGAEYRIEPTLQTITAIADDVPRGSVLTETFKIQTTGAAARTLVPNLRVRFSGLLADWKPGVSVACGTKRNGPTADSPYDRRFDYCLFNGRIDRIELLDVRSGEVLQTVNR